MYRRIDDKIYMTNSMMDAVRSCRLYRAVFESGFYPNLLNTPLPKLWRECVIIVDKNIRLRDSYDFKVVFYGVCMNALRDCVSEKSIWTCDDLNSFMK